MNNTQIQTVEYDLSSATVITKYTLDRLLKEDDASDLIALYVFYAYTANWQITNQPKCVNSYVAKGLNWSESKVKRYKKQLIDMKLIENIRRTNEFGVVIGWYIKVNYIKNTNPPAQNPTRWVEEPEMLNTNSLNAFN